MTTAIETVWKGPEILRPFLVPIDSLEPWPDNPRRGDVVAVRRSLARFGQLKPIVVSGSRIVAGHHVVLAATELEWTHVAVAPNEFENEEEARAFLLADNRTSELGIVDEEALAEQLRTIRERSTLDGTGYSEKDAEDLEARLASLRAWRPQPEELDPTDEQPPSLDARSPTDFEVPLLLSQDVRRDFAQWVKLLEREWGIAGVSSVVVRAVREAAQRQ